MKSLNLLTPLLATILGSIGMFPAAAAAEKSDGHDVVGDPYPLATCPVTGKALDAMGEPIIKVINGRELRFCCEGCPPKVEAEPAKYLEKVDAAIAELQRPFYPLERCIVSGEELGSMGKPLELIHGNRLVRLCCAGCVKKFEADPASFLSKIDEAVVKAQKESYPLDFCIVSGDKLGGDMGKTIDVTIGNRLYRVCCKGCIKSLHETPLKYQSMLDDALAGKPVKRPEGSGSKETAKGHGDHEHGDH